MAYSNGEESLNKFLSPDPDPDHLRGGPSHGYNTSCLKRRIKAVEMRCYRRLLHISYKDHITNEIVCTKIQTAIGPYEDLLTTVKKRKLRWYGHVTRSNGLCKQVLQGTVPGKRKRGRQKKRWEDNIKEWTGLDFNNSQRAAEDRQRWKKIVADVSSGAPTTLMVAGHR